MKDMTAIKLSTAFGFFVSVALCQVEPTLTEQGISGTSVTLSAPELAKLPQQTVKTIDHGTPVTFQGVFLKDVLAKVRTPTGEAFNGTVASYYLLGTPTTDIGRSSLGRRWTRRSRIARFTS
jgi:hypothetical protein